MFKERLNALLHNLRNGKYFGDGRIAYMMRVIEYQHRGLPHAHIVFQMDNAPHIDDKTASAEYIDKYVCFIFSLYYLKMLSAVVYLHLFFLLFRWVDSEMPVLSTTPTKDEETYLRYVNEFQIHKCYATEDGEKGCLDEHGHCKRGYKDGLFRNVATFDEKGFPLYKRPAEKDQLITPHHRGMLLDWGAHLNLEFCGSTYTALYLYKYLFKGNKKVKVAFDNTANVLPGKFVVFCLIR